MGDKMELADQSLDMDHSFYPEQAPRDFFWSMTIQPSKRYSETLNEDLHITHVCIGDDAKDNSVSVLYVEPEEGEVHPICRLREGKTDQLALDLYFPAGGDLTLFSSKGSATLHLLGYFQEIDSFDSDEEETDDEEGSEEEGESEEEDEEVEVKTTKRKATAPPAQQAPAKKKAKSAITASAPNLGDIGKEVQAAKKVAKKEVAKKEVAKKEAPKTPKKDAPKTPKKEVAKKEAPKESPKKEAPKKDKDDIGVSKKLAGGVVATVTQAGRGNVVAKNGKKVKVQYRGTLAKGGKQFDAGKIDFRLGVGEVVKGWDIGVNGMKLGEKRTLIIPPGAGYGKRGAPPDIPGNATLKFDVTLLNVQ